MSYNEVLQTLTDEWSINDLMLEDHPIVMDQTDPMMCVDVRTIMESHV